MSHKDESTLLCILTKIDVFQYLTDVEVDMAVNDDLINEVCPIAIWKPIHTWLHAQFFSICVLWTCFTFWHSLGTRTSHSCEGLVPRLILTLQATLLSGIGTNFVLGGPRCIGRSGPKQHYIIIIKSTKAEYTHDIVKLLSTWNLIIGGQCPSPPPPAPLVPTPLDCPIKTWHVFHI